MKGISLWPNYSLANELATCRLTTTEELFVGRLQRKLVIMAGTVLLAYYFECTSSFGIHIQGFFCNDADLMKPYPGTEESSFIPPLILYCVVAATPTTVIFIGEISMYIMKSTREALIAQEKTILTGECCYLNPLIRRIIRFIGVFAFGLFATDIFVNAGQVVTGNLAPYFLSVCKPNYTGMECRFSHQFISNGNICTGNQVVVERARRSFPSKDASLSVYSAVYVTALCVVNNFKGAHSRPVKRNIEDYRSLPLMTFPRVESPLETLSAQVELPESAPSHAQCQKLCTCLEPQNESA
ncbi:hypothetical protein P4O66_005792 [Electrophorus voltai]|uniref:Phospholipid phosphatase-related protein type 1 n=1 Tax=Electrophorus voltai TaxID=2609070 RepID=A0AAD8ZK71_9TELE|nr:hypothetical protein P4O66_005792 [Electrophorus voltai]